VPWIAGLAAVAVLAVLGVTQLGGGGEDGGSGGGGGGDGGGGSNASGLRFVPFEDAKAFTVDVPDGWTPPKPGAVERKLPSATATKLVSPGEDGVATIAQQDERPPREVVTKALAERQAEADAGGFSLNVLSDGDPQTINGHEALLFGYQWKEPGIGPATAFNYAFNDGGFGWRTRAAVAGKGDESVAQAKAIATEMATTFEPR
jgi:hypothetical protein